MTADIAVPPGASGTPSDSNTGARAVGVVGPVEAEVDASATCSGNRIRIGQMQEEV